MSECKFCKSKERLTFDSDTKYDCGSYFYFSSNFNQSNACKTIAKLQSRISELEKLVIACRDVNHGDYCEIPSDDWEKLNAALSINPNKKD